MNYLSISLKVKRFLCNKINVILFKNEYFNKKWTYS